MIVIPCKRVEELSDERKAELRVTNDDWQGKLLDISSYDWKGFSKEFDEFWDVDVARGFVDARRLIQRSCKGLTSQQRAISIDLLACGIATGIWNDEDQAIARVKIYWNWFKQETEKNTGSGTYLKQLIKQEEHNAKAGLRTPVIHTTQLRAEVDRLVMTGCLMEKPRLKDVKELMLDLGWRQQQSTWIKG